MGWAGVASWSVHVKLELEVVEVVEGELEEEEEEETRENSRGLGNEKVDISFQTESVVCMEEVEVVLGMKKEGVK